MVGSFNFRYICKLLNGYFLWEEIPMNWIIGRSSSLSAAGRRYHRLVICQILRMAATLSLHAEELTNSCCADGSTSFEQHSATGATTTTAETTDDAAATMIGCMKLFHRQDGLTVSSMSRNGNGASATSLADVIETDYLRDWTCSRDSHVDDDNSSSHNSDQRSKGFT